MTEFRIFRVFVVMVLGATLAAGTAWATTSSSTQGDYPERTPERSAPANSRSLQSSAISPTATALDIAYAIAPDNSLISDASFAAKPPAGSPTATSDTPLAGFPRNGSGYGILSTGDANSASAPNDSESTSGYNEGGNVRGDTDYDVTILKVDLNVPQGADCLSFDFKFLSEEFDEYIGSSYNDGFIAELDDSTWNTSGSTVSAPNNFASASGDEAPITVNNVGFAASSASAATGTTYDGATNVLRASTPVTPGAHSLFLSIFDQADNVYDSAVFVDKLTAYAAGTGGCDTGVEATDPIVKFAPLVYLHPEEDHWPMSADAFIENSNLMWSHNNCPDHQIRSTGNINSGSLGSGVYRAQALRKCWRHSHRPYRYSTKQHTRPFDSRPSYDGSYNLPNQEGFYLDIDNDFRDGAAPAAGSTTYDRAPVYYEVNCADGSTVPLDECNSHKVITYWFFYGRSQPNFTGFDKAFELGKHEGDWEHVNVHLNADGTQATQVDYFAHHDPAREVPYAESLSEESGTHPVVFSAKGGHGSYPSAGDYPDSCGTDPGTEDICVDDEMEQGLPWKTWNDVLNVEAQPWHGYGGAWGRTGKGFSPETTGPPGPSLYKDPLGSG